MAGYRVTQFKGIRPGRSALKLPEGEGQTALNSKLGSGDLEPWVDVDAGTAIKNLYYNRTIHLYDNDGSPLWFEFDSYVDLVPGSIKGDELERVYYTGDGVPKMTYRAIAASGSGPYPATYRRLGTPAPTIAPTAVGTALPETVDSSARRAISGSIKSKKLEVVFANFTVYPGTGTADAQWNAVAVGQVAFDLQAGDSVKVTEVVDADTVKLGSATGSGAFAVTAANDNSSTDFITSMANNGSTRTIVATGWRIPDGAEATITGHLLRVGDVIRVTRTDYTSGLLLPQVAADDYFEDAWTSPVEVTVDGDTFYQVANGTMLASVDATSDFPSLLGGFFYDVDRAGSDADILEDRSYVYTFVSVLGEEGPPSPPSAAINALDGDTITLTGFEAPSPFFREITKIRLYRTNSTAAGTEYQFVKEFDVATNASDSVKAENLGEVIGTTTWDPPAAGMQGLTSMPNGMMVGFEGKNIYMCEPYFPHAWPAEYDQAIDYEIVGLAAIGNSVAILTEGVPYILSGSHPRNTNIRPYKLNQACVSKESIASTEDRIMYASPDGLVEISVNGAKLITQGFVGKAEWADYVPATLVGEIHDGKYFGFYDGPDNVTQPPAAVVLTGTIVAEGDTPDETHIVAGGRTILLTLTSDTWVASGATFNAIRQDIINGLVSDGVYVTGWKDAMLPNIPVTDVVRTSDTLVTITLSARAEYSITDAETITCVVPAGALTAASALPAAETFTINPLQDYSTRAVAFSDFDTGGTDLAYAVSSQLDIIDWDSYAGVGALNVHEITPTDAVYSASLDRWVSISNNGAGASVLPSTANVMTSDDNGISWTARLHVYSTLSGYVHTSIAWHPTHDVFVIGGENRILQSSADGLIWDGVSVNATIPATADVVSVMVADANSPYMYAALSGTLFLLQSQDLSLLPATNTWSAIPITYPAAVGSKLAASGDGAILSVGSGVTNLEIARTVHNAASGASVGTINTFNCVDLIYANDTWVFISDDFRTVTCGGDDDSDTIGNYSAVSSEHVAAITVSGIEYDAGDSLIQGYGYIVHGIADGSGQGVIYTSPDLSTWTLRHTHVQSVAITALAVKYPETQLASTLLSFSPTYTVANGSTFTSIGDYISSDNTRTANAEAETDMYIQQITGDCLINVVGRNSGADSDNGSSVSASDVDVFNLNEEPDRVRITVTNETVIDPGPGTATKDLLYSAFVDGAYQPLAPNAKYGLQADAINWQAPFPSEPLDRTHSISITTQFAFEKAGYNTLFVYYSVFAKTISSTPL